MFCSKCGTLNPDGFAFCMNCGAALQDQQSPESYYDPSNASAQETVVVANVHTAYGAAPSQNPQMSYGAAARPPQTAPYAPVPNPNKKPSGLNKKVVVITAITCVLILAFVGVGLFFYLQNKANEDSHATTEVQFAFSYSGDEAYEPIGVPLLVEGTDIDNNHVEQQILATSDGGTLNLLAGSYTVSVAGQPVSANGVVYEVEGENLRTLEIAVPGSSGNQTLVPDLNYSFVPVVANKVTDTQIEEIRSWMTTYGVAPDEIQVAIACIKERRNAVVTLATLEKEKQAALGANPTIIYGTNETNHSETVQLTGTVRVSYFNSGASGGSGDVCYLELPKEVDVRSSQYGNVRSSNIILGDRFASYKDKVITVTMWCSCNSSATIKEAPCSMIWANDAQVVRAYTID